ncbi:hypothetical protein DI43_11030 [Geobacillus sp. CAMR12739]|nr:hypothetical protein DI43_11030 [Geobacillus sp. CAMR12739]
MAFAAWSYTAVNPFTAGSSSGTSFAVSVGSVPRTNNSYVISLSGVYLPASFGGFVPFFDRQLDDAVRLLEFPTAVIDVGH